MMDESPLVTLQEIRNILLSLQPNANIAAIGGYPDEIFFELSREANPELICNICYMVIKKTRQCRNGHSFCKACITNWSQNGTGNSSLCPVCRVEGGYCRNKGLDDRISHLLVICPHSDCKWGGDVSGWKKHNQLHETLTKPGKSDELPSLISNHRCRVSSQSLAAISTDARHLPAINGGASLPSTSRGSNSAIRDVTPPRLPNLVSKPTSLSRFPRDQALMDNANGRTPWNEEGEPESLSSLNNLTHIDGVDNDNDIPSEGQMSPGDFPFRGTPSPPRNLVTLDYSTQSNVSDAELNQDAFAQTDEPRTYEYSSSRLSSTNSSADSQRNTETKSPDELDAISPEIPQMHLSSMSHEDTLTPSPSSRLMNIYQMRNSMRDIRNSLNSLVHGIDTQLEQARRYALNVNSHINNLRRRNARGMDALMSRLESVVEQLADFVCQENDPIFY